MPECCFPSRSYLSFQVIHRAQSWVSVETRGRRKEAKGQQKALLQEDSDHSANNIQRSFKCRNDRTQSAMSPSSYRWFHIQFLSLRNLEAPAGGVLDKYWPSHLAVQALAHVLADKVEPVERKREVQTLRYCRRHTHPILYPNLCLCAIAIALLLEYCSSQSENSA